MTHSQNIDIALISSTGILIQIFKLVCNKLNISLSIYENTHDIKKVDVLIVEDDKFDSNELHKYKSLCSKLVVIAKEKIYEYESCYLIKKPFLPSDLLKNIEELINFSTKIANNMDNINEKTQEFDNNVDDLVSFIDSIDENENSNEEFDEITINKNELGYGGVLDTKELNILNDMMNNSDNIEEDIQSKSDWSELSEIIDKAIDDVQDYTFESQDNLIILNNYSMKELEPLLKKFNQDSINLLSSGEELTLKLKLLNNKN